jgi:hypothetical protein
MKGAVVMDFFPCNSRIILLLAISTINVCCSQLKLNNADPYALFSPHKSKIEHNEKMVVIPLEEDVELDITCDCEHERIRINVMPYYQVATTGCNVRKEDTLFYYDNRNINTLSTSNAGAFGVDSDVDSTSNSSNLLMSAPMPLGTIPEPFSFFPLFYPWAEEDGIEGWVYGGPSSTDTNYDPTSGKTNGNITSKALARYLGYNHLPIETGIDKDEKAIYTVDPLDSSYKNYRNNYFSILSYPPARDTSRLFGYGYFNLKYQKCGIRASVEMTPFNTDNIQLRVFTGYSQLGISSAKIMDTTKSYMGPTYANMFSKYGDPLQTDADLTSAFNSNPPAGSQFSDNTLNIYQLDCYSNSVYIDNAPPTDSSRGPNTTFERNSKVSNQFKALYVHNIQNNLRALGKALGQDFGSYYENGFDDITAELILKKDIEYNSSNEQSKKRTSFELRNICPFISIHSTAPISPESPANKVFARPIGNNGHWEYGAFCGCAFDLSNKISFGMDAGLSIFGEKRYTKMPVPTKTLEEGVYTYSADISRQPGASFSFGLFMQSDWFIKNISFWGEYRFIHHSNDKFSNWKILPILPANSGLTDMTVDPPKPSTVITSKLEENSAWTIHMANLSLKWKVTDSCNLNVVLQQPFSLRNAYNTTTIGASIEIII